MTFLSYVFVCLSKHLYILKVKRDFCIIPRFLRLSRQVFISG